MKSVLGGVGSLLLTVGTLSLHAAFSASEGRIALVSDLMQRWPLACSLTFGMGNSMVGLSLYGSQSIYPILACTLSSWAVVGSSEYYGQEWIKVVHGLATTAFVLSSYLVFTGAVRQMKLSEKQRVLAEALSAAALFFSGLALISGGALVVLPPRMEEEGVITSAYWMWRNTMASCEVGLLAFYGVGYVNIFFF